MAGVADSVVYHPKGTVGHLTKGSVHARTGVIIYEYPLTERTRTLLRLEDLFARARHFLDRTDPRDHHAALVTLFEILEVCGRGELKSELLQELERLRQTMIGFRGNARIDQDKLSKVLIRIEEARAAIHGLSGKIGQHLRANEWLMSIRQRTGIPGGACEFDLPTYHRWLHHPAARRSADLAAWILPLQPIEDATAVALGLLRDSGSPETRVATRGLFQQMMTGRVAQMVQIRLDDDALAVPEASANRYALNIRFVTSGEEPRPRPIDVDVSFDLTFCSI